MSIYLSQLYLTKHNLQYMLFMLFDSMFSIERWVHARYVQTSLISVH